MSVVGAAKSVYESLRELRPKRLLVRGSGHLHTADWRLATSPLRPRPDFVIPGAQKAGTTSLFEYLTSLEGIGHGARKEIHFPDRLMYREVPTWVDEHYYRSFFPLTSDLAGEASPYYLFHPRAARRLADVAPRARLVVLLRDPVERAYSHYHHEYRKGRERLPFREAVEAEEERLEGEVGRLRRDPTYDSFEHTHFSYLARGRYARQLKRLFRHFPRRQVLVVDSHRLFRRTRRVLRKVLAFLGLPPRRAWEADVDRVHQRGDYPPMDGETERRLREHFAPHDEKLRELLGRRLSWM